MIRDFLKQWAYVLHLTRDFPRKNQDMMAQVAGEHLRTIYILLDDGEKRIFISELAERISSQTLERASASAGCLMNIFWKNFKYGQADVADQGSPVVSLMESLLKNPERMEQFIGNYIETLNAKEPERKDNADHIGRLKKNGASSSCEAVKEFYAKLVVGIAGEKIP